MSAIAISGAGIAGLSAGLALARRGHSVVIHEHALEITETGAGIQLSPNASKILAGWGLGAALAKAGTEPEFIHLADGQTGTVLTSLPLRSVMRARHGGPYVVLHRSDLQEALLAGCLAAGVAVKTGSEITGAAQSGDRVRFTLAGDRQDECDLLIGADGINSVLRAGIDAAARPAPDGQTAWRAEIPLAGAEGLIDARSTTVFMGAGRHMVAYRMGARETVNLVAISAADAASPGAAFSGWDGPARSLIIRAENWLNWPLRAVACQSWVRGRQVLLGDAAHAMTPHAAQGGAMAIEDAFVLADCLSVDAPLGDAPLDEALARYERLRRERTGRVAALSVQNRNIYQLGGPLALARNIGLKALPPELALRRLDWLYGWH